MARAFRFRAATLVAVLALVASTSPATALTVKQKHAQALAAHVDRYVESMETFTFGMFHQIDPKYHAHLQTQLRAAAKNTAYKDRAFAAAGEFCNLFKQYAAPSAFGSMLERLEPATLQLRTTVNLAPGKKPYASVTTKVLRAAFTLFGYETAARCPLASLLLAALRETPSAKLASQGPADRVLAAAQASADSLLGGYVTAEILDAAGTLEQQAVDSFAVDGYDKVLRAYVSYREVPGEQLLLKTVTPFLLSGGKLSLGATEVSLLVLG
jgi:hypothetical protein